VMTANVAAVTALDPDSTYRARFDRVARLLTGDENTTAHDGVAWLQRLCAQLNIPTLSTYGITPNAFDEVITKSKQASSMKGNPVVLADQDLQRILEAAL